MKTFRISHYSFSNTDTLLFDANIWLFIYSPQYRPSDRRTAVYSAALKEILRAQSRIFIDTIVLSEFVNVLARNAFYSIFPHAEPNEFKRFRKSSAFRPVAKNIGGTCRRVLSHCTRTASGFSSLDIEVILTEFEVGKADFNDLVLASLCKANGLTFVTDDADFKGTGLKILTENRHLLA